MITLDSISDLHAGVAKIESWRCGRIVMRQGKLVSVQHRLLCGSASIAQVWWQARYGRADNDICWLDYHQPFGMPAFLTLDYIRAGKSAGIKSFIGACKILDEVAKIRGTQAIVAHVTNHAISDRLLARLGWQQHLENWNGRHWIRRFYDGYPDSVVHRYAA